MTDTVTSAELHAALTDVQHIASRLSRTLDAALQQGEIPDPETCTELLRRTSATLDRTGEMADRWEEQEDQWLRDLAAEHDTAPGLPSSTDIALEAIAALNRPTRSSRTA